MEAGALVDGVRRVLRTLTPTLTLSLTLTLSRTRTRTLTLTLTLIAQSLAAKVHLMPCLSTVNMLG